MPQGLRSALRRMAPRTRTLAIASWMSLTLLTPATAADDKPRTPGVAPIQFRLGQSEPIAQPASTRAMARRLAQLAAEIPPSPEMFYPHKAVEFFATRLEEATTPDLRMRVHLPYAMALLNNGQTEDCLAQIAAFEAGLASRNASLRPEDAAQLLELRAIAYLRLGEQENCLHHHNADSCLLPIRGGGVHELQRGSRGAVEVLHQLLDLRPSPFAAWLLNLAYMTLGEYPEKVPPQWLVPEKVFASDFDLPRFPDVAGPLGLDVNDLSGGVVMEDFNNDGFLDLMVSASGVHSPLAYFSNNGDGTFSELTRDAGLQGLTGGLNLVPADFDNDGLIDVLVLRGAWLGELGRFPNSLLRNMGNHRFVDVTEQAGLLSFHPTQTATWLDYNGDGWIDLFIGNETIPGSAEVDPCELYRNNGDGTFTECAAEHGLAIQDWIKGVTSGDFNNDGRPDLYLSSLVGPNRLLRNDGPATPGAPAETRWRFTDVALVAGVTEPLRSFPCWFFDYDNDGWQDLFVTGYSIRNAGDILADYLGVKHQGERARLYRNNRDGTFRDVTAGMGLDRILHAMGCNFGDLDNDGWLDFYVGTGDPNLGTLVPNLMFRNDGGARFQDVTTSGGFGQLQKGHGIAFGDLNHDGAQDVYSVVGGAFAGDAYHNQLFANPGNAHSWLKLRLEGVQSNRAALGARIKVVVESGGAEREIHRVVTTGGSFGASSLRQEIGLGAATRIVRVEIHWPASGKTQQFAGLALNRLYHIREGDEQPRKISLSGFNWPATPANTGGHHHH